MPISTKFDYIIIGAGCAGLSLAYRLLEKNYKICILESSDNINSKNKLWSFWDTYKHPFSHLVKKKWKQLLIKNELESIRIDCSKYNYQTIDSHNFNNYVLDNIKLSKNINIVFSEKVNDIYKNYNDIVLITNNNKYCCNHVFDSRPNKIIVNMRQQFFGAYIESKKQIFNESLPVFMDFSNVKNKLHFVYLLPFSKNEALVESTYFSSQKESNLLDEYYINEYMQKNFINNEYFIKSIEVGSIPMDVDINSLSEKYITMIGSYSGVTRASTGYTFINIQRQADFIVKQILNNKNKYNKKKYFHPYILRKMDKIFLEIIKKKPEYIKKVLMSMFRGKKHNSQIRFLSDIPTFLDIIKIILYIPKKKFIKYLIGLKE